MIIPDFRLQISDSKFPVPDLESEIWNLEYNLSLKLKWH